MINKIVFPKQHIHQSLLNIVETIKYSAKEHHNSITETLGLVDFPYAHEQKLKHEFSYPDLVMWSEHLRHDDYHDWIENLPLITYLCVAAKDGTYEDISDIHPEYQGKGSISDNIFHLMYEYYCWMIFTRFDQEDDVVDNEASIAKLSFLNKLTEFTILERFCISECMRILFSEQANLQPPVIPVFAITIPDIIKKSSDHPVVMALQHVLSVDSLTFEHIHTIFRGMEISIEPISVSLSDTFGIA